MLYLACFMTVFLLPGPVFGGGLEKLPGERRRFKGALQLLINRYE